MIHPTRTQLLLLKDKALTVSDSIGLLKGRRQALLREFLQVSAPLLRSRRRLAELYAEALDELAVSRAQEGAGVLSSLVAASQRDLGLDLLVGNVMGLHFREVTVARSPLLTPLLRPYDYRATSPHLEEAIQRFETIVAEMLELAVFEGKVKRLGEELLRMTRRIRVLEERVLPGLRGEIREIARYLGEREREAGYRLKLFKGKLAGG